MFSKLPERLQDKIEYVPESGCWIWCGGLTSAGYGQIELGLGTTYVHRIVYELFKGIIPSELELDHLCRVTCCCNPDHLEPVTHLENVRRGDAGKYLSARTHCSHGHSYQGENLYIRPDGKGRQCRECNRAGGRRFRARKKESRDD